MGGPELVLVLRYRKAVTYGFHVLLGALGQHETATRYEVRFGDTDEAYAQLWHDLFAGGAARGEVDAGIDLNLPLPYFRVCAFKSLSLVPLNSERERYPRDVMSCAAFSAIITTGA